MAEKTTVEMVCDACGKRGPVEMHSKLAEAVHARTAQDKITEILCSACSAARKEDCWTMKLG